MFHRCVFVTLLAVGAAGIVAGQTDLEALRIKAAQGDAEAQYKLGDWYYSGKEVKQDSAEAIKWYRLAADFGA